MPSIASSQSRKKNLNLCIRPPTHRHCDLQMNKPLSYSQAEKIYPGIPGTTRTWPSPPVNSLDEKGEQEAREKKRREGRLDEDLEDLPPRNESVHKKRNNPSIHHQYEGEGTLESPYIVDWNINDPENPYNWPRTRRWALTYQVRLVLPKMRHSVTRLLARSWDLMHLFWIFIVYWGIARGKGRAAHEHSHFNTAYFPLRCWVWARVSASILLPLILNLSAL